MESIVCHLGLWLICASAPRDCLATLAHDALPHTGYQIARKPVGNLELHTVHVI